MCLNIKLNSTGELKVKRDIRRGRISAACAERGVQKEKGRERSQRDVILHGAVLCYAVQGLFKGLMQGS